MARGFDLTAEINLRGPSNIRTIVADIRRQLGTIEANVDVQINPATARNLDTLNRNFSDFNRTLTTTRTSADAVSSSLRNLAQAVQAASGRSNQLPRNLQQINNAAQNLTRQNNAAQRATRDLTGSFEDFGRQSALAVRRFAAFATVTGVIYKVSAAVTGAAKDFIDFDKELVRVAQVTDTSVKNLGSLVSQITRLSTTFGVASKDLIQVSSTLAQAGLSARDTEKALRALALSALAPSFDSLNETVEGSIALMRQFGIGAGDLEKALGSVNAVAAKFAVEASDLITAIQRTGGVFATASKGVSEGTDALNEFIAVFTSVRATTRESAETIATGLRTIFTRIQRGSTIEALKEYGVALTDLEGKFVGPFEAVRRLSAGLNQLDPRDLKFSRIVEELGGFRQIGKVIPLIQQFATAQAALKVAQTGQDSLAKDTTIAQQALARQIGKVKEEFVGLIRSIGQSEGFQTIVKLTLDLTSNLIKMADAAKGALPAIAAIMAFRGASAFNQYAIGFLGGIRGRPGRPQGANSGGYIRAYASGGYVPGTGNSDTVPAMLTPGEFVIRKKAVETIGANNLQRLNKYSSGGRVKFKGGGFASAPMVDDITANTRGSVLPNRIALEQILKTGYGALDFDRTLKRTIGDSAYGKAKTSPQKEAVLNRYFRNPSVRLADATSATITNFGKQLLEAIKTGKVDPRKLSVISKSRRTPGLAEHIQELFGIPKDNMIFTAGGSKEPALEALRQKGPRVSRVFKSLGGIVQKFQKAGEVKPQNLSTQDKLNIARSQNIAPSAGGLLRDLQQNLKSVGAAVLEPESRNPSNSLKFTLTQSDIERTVGSKVKNLGFGSRTITGYISGLSDNTFRSFSSALDNGIVSGINTAARELATDIGIGISSIDDSTKSQFLRGINAGTRGNLFEDVLTLMSGKFDRSSGRPFDFPDGLPSLQIDDFANLPNKWIDAKASFSRAYRSGEGSLENKTLKQISNEILAQKKKYLNVPSANNQNLSDKSSAIRAALAEIPGGYLTDEIRSKFGLGAKQLATIPGIEKKGNYWILSGGVANSSVRRASGGSISGGDTVPALLTPGEFVINKKAAQQIGASKLHQLNRADKVQGFNKGGAVGYVQKFANGGDAEARIQRYMMLFEGFLDNITNTTYRANRAAGVGATQALNNSRRVAGREFSDAASVVIRSASPENRMAAAEASSRVISQYMQRSATSAESVSRSSSLSQRAFQAIQNSTSRVRGFFARSSAADTPAADRAVTNTGGRFNLPNFGLSLAFIGPAIGDAIVNALGTDKVQNKGYSSAITGVTSSLAIGAQFGPMGAFAGAILGAVSAVDNFNKGVAEAEIELSKLKIDKETDTAEKNIEKLLRQPNNATANQNLLASLRSIGLEEAKNIENENLKRQPGVISNTLDSYFGKNSLERLTLGFYKNSNLSAQDVAEQEASQNRMGSDIARKALTTKIEQGFTFDQALSSFGTSGAAAIRSNILEADKEYRQKLAELNEQAKTDPKIAINLAERQKALADKYFLLTTEAERALSADKQRVLASQKLAKTLALASVSITQTFENMNQALGRAKFEFESVSQRSDELLNNQVSPNITFRSRNILDNPNAYSADERRGAVRQVSGMFGQDSRFVEAFYNFGDNIENTIRNIAVQAQRTGNNENVSDKIVNELTRQMIPIFGDNRITDSVRQQLKEAIQQQPRGEIDPQKLLDIEGFRQIIEYSKASFNTLKNQFETLGDIINSYGQQVEKATAIQQQVQDNLAGLQSSLINTSFRLKEIFGRDVDINARLGSNRLEAATRFGINPREMDSNRLMSRRQLLMANREEIQAKLQQATTTQSLNVRGIATLQTSLIKLDREIKNVDNALGNLPGVIEKNINDILGEMQRINSERENKLQAGIGFAEKLVGSTPEELTDLNNTYAVLNNTLRGNLVTINQSTSAQKAYFETLNKGGSPVEAMSAAQQAFATQTQKALGMFNELIQISGLRGQEVNTMRADLLENFARAQGTGLQNSPIFRQIIALLRQPPEEDKQLIKLGAMLERERKALIEATNNVNNNLLKQQQDVLANANQGLIQAMNSLQAAFEAAQKNNAQNGIDRPGNQMPNVPAQPQQSQPPQNNPRTVWQTPPRQTIMFGQRPAGRSKGGIVYASSGGYLSKGSDTVPAMLSDGEFVVNSKATQNNLPLLHAINSGYSSGGIVYLAGGGVSPGNDPSRFGPDGRLLSVDERVEMKMREAREREAAAVAQLNQQSDARIQESIERSKAVPVKAAEITPSIPIPEKKSKPLKTPEQHLADIKAEAARDRAAKEERQRQKPEPKPMTPEDAELERQVQLAREGTQRRERNRLDAINEIRKQNNARIRVKRALMAENPEMTDQELDTLDQSLNRVFARKTPGVDQNADAVRLEIKRINEQAVQDAAYRQYVAKGTITDQALEVYGAGLKSVAENPITQAATALGTAGAGAVRTTVGLAAAGAAGLSGEIYKGVSGGRSSTLDAIRDVSLDEATRGINNMTGAGSSLGEVGAKALGAVSLSPESQATFKDLEKTYRVNKESFEGVAAGITAKRAAQAEQVVQGGSRFQGGADLVTELTSPSVGVPLGRIAGAADKIADTRKAVAGTTQFVPVEGLQQAANNLYRRSNPLSLLDQNPMRFVPEAEAAAAAYSTRNLGRMAGTTVSSSKVAPKAVSSGTVKLGEKFRSPLIEKAGLKNTQIDAVVKKFGDETPRTRRTYDPTSDMGPITAKDQKDFNRLVTKDIPAMRVKAAKEAAKKAQAEARLLSKKAKAEARTARENSFLGKMYKSIKGYALTAGSVTGVGSGVNAFTGYFTKTSEDQEKSNRKPIKRNRGGLIYASEGTLIPYEPKGTDTVPAMLTPGEFVINRASTQKHLPLLKAINQSRGGSVKYLANGGISASNIQDPILLRSETLSANQNNKQNTLLQKNTNYKVSKLFNSSDILSKDVSSINKDQLPKLNKLNLNIDKTTKTNLDNTKKISENIKGASQFKSGGIIYAADGKLVDFKPKGTDTVPAMLTPGEFVVNASSTQKHLPLLKAINEGNYKNKGGVIYASDGGPISPQNPLSAKEKARLRAIKAIPPHKRSMEQNQVISDHNTRMKQDDTRSLYDARAEYRRLGNIEHRTPLEEYNRQDLRKFLHNGPDGENSLQERINRRLNILKKPDPVPGIPSLYKGGIVYAQKGTRIPINKKLAEHANSISFIDAETFNFDQMKLLVHNSHELMQKLLGADRKNMSKRFDKESLPGNLNRLYRNYIYNPLLESSTSGRKGADMYADQYEDYFSPEAILRQKTLSDGGVVNKPDTAVQAIKQDEARERSRKKAYELYLRRFGRYRPEDPQAARDVVQILQKNGNQQELDRAVRSYAQIKDAKAQIDRENQASWGAAGFEKGGVVYLQQGGIGGMLPGADEPLSPLDEIRIQRRQAADEAREERTNNAFYTRSRLGGLFKRIDDQLETFPDQFELANPNAIDETLTPQKVIDKLKQAIQGLDAGALDNKVIELRSADKNRYNKLMEYVTNSKEGYNIISSNRAFGATSRVLRDDTYANILKEQVISGSKETTALKEAWLKIDRVFPAGKNADQNQANMQQFVNMMGIGFNGGRPRGMSVGGVVYANKGQLIPYQPKGTDTVPAMLTPGEFVINRQATQKNLPLLKAINDNQLASGGMVSPIYAQGGMRVGSAGIGVGQQPSSQDKALMLLSGILQGINQLNKNLPAEKTRQEDPTKTVLGPGTSKMGRGLPGETPIQQAFREGRSAKSVKIDRQFGAAADRYEKRAAYELAKESRSQAYNDKQMRGRIARGEVSDQDAEAFRQRQSNPAQLEKERQEAVFNRIGTLRTGSEYSEARMQGVNSRLFGQISSLNPNTGGATVQAGPTNVATTQIAGGTPPATMPNFDQIFGPLTTNVTQFTQALSTATPFLNQIATFASNTNFQSQQGGVSNGRDNGESGSLSLDGISQFTTKFEAFIGQLKGLNLPPIINVQGNHKVEVVFNGASTLENLATESIQAMVLKEVNMAMNKLNQDTEGALGGKS